jgi:hypothetical protein
VAQTDPEAAIRAIENLSLPDDKSTLDSLAQLWATRDISAATTWALARPAGETRDSVVDRVGYVMAEKNPLEAANLVAKNITPGETQTEAAISILHRWALQDWSSARDWAHRFPEGPLRERAEREIAGIKFYNEALTAAPKVQ